MRSNPRLILLGRVPLLSPFDGLSLTKDGTGLSALHGSLLQSLTQSNNWTLVIDPLVIAHKIFTSLSNSTPNFSFTLFSISVDRSKISFPFAFA